MAAKKQLCEDIIRPVVEGMGYECWGIEYLSQGKHSLVRVYIESIENAERTKNDQNEPSSEDSDTNNIDGSTGQGSRQGGSEQNSSEQESGIELKDCELVSRQLSGVLDVEEPISGDYTLEVSSPGLDRPLYKLSHYERFKGHHVALKLRMPFEGRRKFNGVLSGVEGNDIVLLVEQEEYLFPLEGIEKANVVPQFD